MIKVFIAKFQKHLANSGWLIFDKLYRMILTFATTAFIGRYLGPIEFGKLSFAQTFVAFFGPLIHLGLEQIIVREFVTGKIPREKILGTAFVVRMIGAVLSLLFVFLGMVTFMDGKPADSKILIFILSLLGLFQPFDGVNSLFRAGSKSKNSVLTGVVVLGLGFLIRLVLMRIHAPVWSFAMMLLLEGIATFLFPLYFFREDVNLKNWSFDKNLARILMRESWPLVLSSFGVLIYMKSDQFFINYFLGEKENGLYAVALKFSESWYFFPMAISTSFYPLIVETSLTDKMKADNYIIRLNQFYLALSLIVGLFVYFAADTFIPLFFGPAYDMSSTILKIHIWSGAFVALGVVRNYWLANERLLTYNLAFTIIPAIVNPLCNYFLIKHFSLVGLAWSVVITQLVASVLANAFFPATRKIFKMQMQAFFPFYRGKS